MIVASAAAIVVRVVAIVVGLGLWFLTQRLLAKRAMTTDPAAIADGIHALTARWHRALTERPSRANMLLIASSLVIDLLGAGLLGSAILGATFRPFVGLLMLFALRQLCQALCPLPPPPEMIWRDPGFPTVLVTYGTANDLFFSGHTAIAVFGACWLASTFGAIGLALGIAVAVFEIAAVLVLRAHYTMDVFAGAVTALWVQHLAARCAPHVDGWIAAIAGR